MLKKKENQREVRNQIINNYIYYSKHEVNELLALTFVCLFLGILDIYLISIHIVLLLYYNHKICKKALIWYRSNRLNKLKIRHKKPYYALDNKEKKELQKLYHFSGKYDLGINVLTGTIFLYAIVFYLNNIIDLTTLLIILILYNIYLILDLKRLKDWYKSMI